MCPYSLTFSFWALRSCMPSFRAFGPIWLLLRTFCYHKINFFYFYETADLSAYFQTAINLAVFNIFGWIFCSHARNYLKYKLEKKKNYFCFIFPEKNRGALRSPPPMTNHKPKTLWLIGLSTLVSFGSYLCDPLT